MLTRRLLLAASAALPVALAQSKAPASRPEEWRNKQPSMAYRRLGRTGLMVSEVVSGGDPITSANYQHLKLALEMGLNYLDMAPAYNRGDTEVAYGKLLAETKVRDKVFLTTKVSAFGGLRNRLYKAVFDGLPGDQQAAVVKRAEALRRASIAEKPGYFIEYFPGQRGQYASRFLNAALMPDYAHKVEGSQEFRQAIVESVETSLKRLGTDHFDILMCPHGAAAAAELDNPHIRETFQGLKKAGKVRFLGVSTHNDPAEVLRKATELGHYDVVMLAYNVINGGYLEQPMQEAAAKGVGLIAMKAAHAVATHHKALQPVPRWRVDKIDRIIPGEMKAPLKSYLWALQNPHLTAVISNLWDETYVRENLAIAGKKVELQPA